MRSDDPSVFAPGSIRICGQVVHQLKKLRRLADEQPHRGEEFHDSHSSTASLGGTDDGAAGKLSAEERARFGHDQIRLKGLAAKGLRVEIWKGNRNPGDRIDRTHLERVACFVGPGLKVHGFGGANADKNAQDLDTAGT